MNGQGQYIYHCPSYDVLPHCWLIFECQPHLIRQMDDAVFTRFLQFHATSERRVAVLFDKSIGDDDKYARYYRISEIMSWNRDTSAHLCILYGSKEVAEQALHLMEVEPVKKSRKRKAA